MYKRQPFLLLGVGDDGTTPNALLALNLITGYCPAVVAGTVCETADSWVTQSLADNIISIKAIYGVAAGALDAGISSWEEPTGATWDACLLYTFILQTLDHRRKRRIAKRRFCRLHAESADRRGWRRVCSRAQRDRMLSLIHI